MEKLSSIVYASTLDKVSSILDIESVKIEDCLKDGLRELAINLHRQFEVDNTGSTKNYDKDIMYIQNMSSILYTCLSGRYFSASELFIAEASELSRWYRNRENYVVDFCYDKYRYTIALNYIDNYLSICEIPYKYKCEVYVQGRGEDANQFYNYSFYINEGGSIFSMVDVSGILPLLNKCKKVRNTILQESYVTGKILERDSVFVDSMSLRRFRLLSISDVLGVLEYVKMYYTYRINPNTFNPNMASLFSNYPVEFDYFDWKIENSTSQVDYDLPYNELHGLFDKTKYPSYSLNIHKCMKKYCDTLLCRDTSIILESQYKYNSEDFGRVIYGYFYNVSKNKSRRIHRYLRRMKLFAESKHYCIGDIPEEFYSSNIKDVHLRENTIIDFEVGSTSYSVVLRRGKSVYSKHVRYLIEVFTNSKSFREKLELNLVDSYMPYYQIGLSEMGDVLCSNLGSGVAGETRLLTDSYEGVDGIIPANQIIGMFNYVFYYTDNVDVIKSEAKSERSNNSTSTKKSSVSTPEEDDVHYIRLNKYVIEYDTKAESYIYKGGTHKSPVEHERRSYFRRVPNNHGKYDLINGEFIRVKDGTGMYTFVKATTVNRGKSSGTVVYVG